MKEKLGHMMVVSEVSADTMGGLVVGIALQSCSKLRQGDKSFVSHSHWL